MDWVQVASNFGVPMLILASLGVALWRIGVWIGDRIVDPLVRSHINAVNTLNDRIPKQCEKLDAIREAQDENTSQLIALRTATESQTSILKSTIERSQVT